jgi:hypothetical protein
MTATYPRLYRVSGAGTDTDISPLVGSNYYGPHTFTQRSVVVADNDANTVLLFGASSFSVADSGVFLTRNCAIVAASGWTTLVAPSASVPWRTGYIAGDNASTFYLMGLNGALGAVTDGLTIDVRTGNISTSGRIVGLCGG